MAVIFATLGITQANLVLLSLIAKSVSSDDTDFLLASLVADTRAECPYKLSIPIN